MNRQPLLICLAIVALLLGYLTSSIPAQDHLEPPSDENLVVVHYHRYDDNYDRAGLWTWDGRDQKTPADQEIMAEGTTPYGVFFVIDPSQYGNDDSDAERIGFIPRLRQDWNAKDGTDRFWTPEIGREIWLIGNDPGIYTQAPDVSPQIAAAYIDGPRYLLLKVTELLPVSQVSPGFFSVTNSQGESVQVKGAIPRDPVNGRARYVGLTLGDDLDIQTGRYQVAADGYHGTTATPRGILDNPDLYGTDELLGVIYAENESTFRVFSPMATSMALMLYDEPLASDGRKIPMEHTGKGIWEVSVEENLEGKFYRLEITTDKYGTHVVLDPEATNTTGDESHARITDMRETDPPGFRPIKRPAFGSKPTSAVIYEMHVRDFTIDAESGVDEDLHGKYPGFVQPATHHPEAEDLTTGIEHLKELGVTHVQIMPFQDFDNDETDPSYGWGYMTSFFNSPDGWFATKLRDETRIREVKQMVKALHDAGIRVIMDVVYNHTGTQASFELIAPGYYLRMRDDGSFYNGSGTGNEFRSEAPMARKFIIDSCKFWIEEYGIDGFRFDLMGLTDLETMKQLRAELDRIDPSLMLYGEPWAGSSETGIDVVYKDRLGGNGIGAFNDNFRNALKGPPDGGEPGYVQDGRNRDGVKRGIEGAINDWAASPLESINYATCHDNLTLWDKLHEALPGQSPDDYIKMQKLTMGVLAVSQGVLFFHGGAELCRTKHGVHNSYNSGDAINMIEWDRKRDFHDVFEFYRAIIALRRAHPVFQLASREEVQKRLRFRDDLCPVEGSIVFVLDGEGLEVEEWSKVAVLINPGTTEQEFANPLEGLPVRLFVRGSEASETPLRGELGREIEVPGRSMVLLAVEAETKD